MDLQKTGMLLATLRKQKGLTQKEIADKLGITPKTVSKWETGHGFPDVATVSSLAEILGVSEQTVLSGKLEIGRGESGNMKKTKFYVCPTCGSFLTGTANSQIVCCGKPLEALVPKKVDSDHEIRITQPDDEFYIEFHHPMTKEHYISFVSYVRFDRILTVRLYPEQDGAVRIPRMYGGKLYSYCNRHGLMEHPLKSNKP